MKKLLNLILLFFLVACGGGGGGGGGGGVAGNAPVVSGGGDDTPAPSGWISSVSSTEANVYRTSEYNKQWGLEAIHAAEAYALLEKNDKAVAGEGVIVAVTDTGVRNTHQEIAGNIINSLNKNFTVSPSTNDVTDTDGHGTHVMSTIIGVKDAVGIHGIAYNAKAFSVEMIGSSSESGIEYAADNGAKVINASWGYNRYSTYDGNSDGEGGSYGITADFSEFLAAKSLDVLTVIATANSADQRGNGQGLGQNPDYLLHPNPDVPAIYANNTQLQGYILAVGALEEYNGGYRIADFSNNCGVTKDYCLTAPGVSIFAGYKNSDSNYIYNSGTSMAAPHVAGAAAVIRAAWPFLTAPQTAQILLTTATDLGATGVDDIYGRGMLNLYAAVQAQGQNLLSYGSSVSSAGYDVRSSSMISSPIFGDAFANNVAPKLANAVFFDDYGRDYKAALDKKITSYKPTHQTDLSYLMNNNISSRMLPLRFGQDGKSKMRFSLSSYKDSEAQNVMGLKHLVMDRSIDPQKITNQNNGFSFVQNDVILPNSSFGFAFNFDEISASQQKDFGASGFILKNNFAAGPYQDFMRQGSVNIWQNSRKFNQLFLDQSFFDQKFALKFSYQSSYESPQIAVNGTKQNQIVDFGMSFKAKNDLSFLLSGGNLTEFNNNMLNSRSVGAFESIGDVKTSYVKFTAAKKFFKNFQFIASFSEGVSKINGNQIGIFRSFDNVRSRSTSIALVHNNFLSGELGLSYLEPLRVYRGSVNFDVAVARDNAGNLTRYQGSASLAPNGKEQDFEIFYLRNLNNLSNVRMNFLVQKEMANIKNFPTNYLGFVSYSKRF